MIEEAELLDAPQVTISYSRTYNLGNYENEKLFVSLSPEDDETPQQAMIRARAIVDEMHNTFQAERDRAEKITNLNRTIESYRRGIKRYQELLGNANQPLPVIKPAEAEVDSDDVIVALEATIEVLQAERLALEDAYHAYLHERNSQVKAAQDDEEDGDDEDYEEDDDL